MSLTRKIRSTTLFEVIVATVIFSLVMAGMVGVFVAGKRHVFHSRERMAGSEMGKLFLDPLHLHVRQSDWDDTTSNTNALLIGTTYCDSSGVGQNPACPSVAGQRKVNNIDYSAQYDVNSVSGTGLRRVKVHVNWTEFSP
jgi:Tfp pilus assembly protein PilV